MRIKFTDVTHLQQCLARRKWLLNAHSFLLPSSSLLPPPPSKARPPPTCQDHKMLSAYKNVNLRSEERKKTGHLSLKKPSLVLQLLAPSLFFCSPPIRFHNSFLKHPTSLHIRAITVMARVQDQAGRIKERQAPLIQPHTVCLSPFWKPVTQR